MCHSFMENVSVYGQRRNYAHFCPAIEPNYAYVYGTYEYI